MDRLFVLVTEIGGTRKQYAVFPDEGDAGAAYFDIYHECVDGRSEENAGDPAAVTDCWLYEVSTASEVEAIKLAMNWDGKLLSRFEPPDDE